MGIALYNSVIQYLLRIFYSVIVEVISMVKNEDMRYWNVPVPKSLDEALEAAIKEKGYRTKTEFIRGVVRRELEHLGIKPVLEPAST